MVLDHRPIDEDRRLVVAGLAGAAGVIFSGANIVSAGPVRDGTPGDAHGDRMELLLLTGEVAVVAGAARGIGRAARGALAARERRRRASPRSMHVEGKAGDGR